LVVALTTPTKPIPPTAPTMSHSVSGGTTSSQQSTSPVSQQPPVSKQVNTGTQANADKSAVGTAAAEQPTKNNEVFSTTAFGNQEDTATKTELALTPKTPVNNNSSSGFVTFLAVVVVVTVILAGWRLLKTTKINSNTIDKDIRTVTKIKESHVEVNGPLQRPGAAKGANFDFRV